MDLGETISDRAIAMARSAVGQMPPYPELKRAAEAGGSTPSEVYCQTAVSAYLFDLGYAGAEGDPDGLEAATTALEHLIRSGDNPTEEELVESVVIAYLKSFSSPPVERARVPVEKVSF
jgi:hypothetical protein